MANANVARRQNAAPAVELQPVHRMAFLQALMAAGYWTEATCKEKLKQITGAHSGEEAIAGTRISTCFVTSLRRLCSADELYAKAISESNAALEFANFRVRNIMNPVSDKLASLFVVLGMLSKSC
jgi:hypothetical protein